MKKTVIFILVLVVLAFGFILMGRGGNVGQKRINTTGITFASFSQPPREYDFGRVSMTRGKVEHDFELKNDSQKEIVIKQMMSSCMCTSASLIYPDGKIIGPFGMAGHGFIPQIDAKVEANEKVKVRVTFDPAAHGPAGIGRIEREVYLDLADQGRTTLNFRVEVTP